MHTRNWSIRSKILSLVAAPLAALVALWVFATVLTVGPALNLLSIQTLLDTVGHPGEVLIAELQRERRLSTVYLSDDDRDGADLGRQRAGTDRAVADFRRTAAGEDARDAAEPVLTGRIDAVLTALDALPSARGYIDRREVDTAGAHNLYTAFIESAFRMFYSAATFNEPAIDRNIRALTTMGRARETLSQADAVLAGAFTTGRLTAADHARLVEILGVADFLYAEGQADLPDVDRATFDRLAGQGAFARLDQLQATIVAAGSGPVPIGQADWDAAYGTVVQQVRDFELTATDSLDNRAMPVAVGILLRLAAAALLGLLAVVVCALVSLRVGRSLIGRLTGLRAAALDLAGNRLPAVVGRLRRGETVDVAAEAPPLEYGADEIGQVGSAFTEVQRTAVQSAVDEAALRRGLNEVFLNIARRSQALLHRQLAVLDTMERRATDPAELEDLFRIDHLATRMRRHAEDLVILAGAKPGRGWRNPVPVVDVVRGAISEVEDYKRIDITAVQDAAVAGRAVGDVIHLLAELLENAASFSPPHTRVHVAGQAVPNGYAIEIEDRGLGMPAEALEDANRALLEPPAFDPSDSARLGLFVVAQLGARHGVRVQLRSSPYGGVTAVALLPLALVTVGGGRTALTAAPTSASPASPASPAPASVSPASARPGDVIDLAGVRVRPEIPGPRPPADDEPAADLPSRRRTAPAEPNADGLPQRRRVEAAAAPAEPPAAGAAAPRTPDEVRSLMSGLQAGTRRGRLDATGDLAPAAAALRPAGADDVPGHEPGGPADPPPADRQEQDTPGPGPRTGEPAPGPSPGAAPGATSGAEPGAAPGAAAGEPDGRDADWAAAWAGTGWAEAVTAPYPVAATADQPAAAHPAAHPAAAPTVHIGEILPARPHSSDTERDG
ncbi:sensor histidine kinase [Spirilliplanes yamanashiensis]|uniref:histidine kinase n=1 Tax=Spirilliplanes yamanashiensis TaxID=42233 RepID=A0A8J3YDQ5_9ACTN|nr:sensor histidine kinase [Spirilliplanes yamanashiensis]MDP9816318.1 signal transduction histidine kinase [Spirilliplanes yamanashiensis]GIJ05845.1 hypothetical protein Sya03_51970 [Spirilliplanes yamanashiensis]